MNTKDAPLQIFKLNKTDAPEKVIPSPFLYYLKAELFRQSYTHIQKLFISV